MRQAVAWLPGGLARRIAAPTLFLALLSLSAHVAGDDQLLGSVVKLEEELQGLGPELRPFLDDSKVARQRQPLSASCDLWSGRWVYDTSYPLYDPFSCPWNMFSCIKRGRQDTNYTHFRWQPNGCNIPRLIPAQMRHRLRGRRVIFFGDSIGRNHFLSLLCILSSDIADHNGVIEEVVKEVYNRLVYKFHDFNFTIEHYFSSYLIDEQPAPNNTLDVPEQVKWVLDTETIETSKFAGPVVSDPQLGNDKLILVVNSEHWWHEGTLFDNGRVFLAPGSKTVNTSMPVFEAYEASMRTVAKWMAKLQEQGASVFWRSYAPAHFLRVGNKWGSCNVSLPIPGPTRPLQTLVRDPTWRKGALAVKIMDEARIPVLDIGPLSNKRPDSHPGNFYAARNPSRADCSHWCLPGVPDTWSELFMAYLIAHNIL